MKLVSLYSMVVPPIFQFIYTKGREIYLCLYKYTSETECVLQYTIRVRTVGRTNLQNCVQMFVPHRPRQDGMNVYLFSRKFIYESVESNMHK